jgi:uncharacterized RDD family membrane protein YckC
MTTEDLYISRVLDHLPPAVPLRDQIALELRGHIAERVAAGHSLDEALTQLGDPLVLAESYLAAVPLESGSFARRAVAKIIDCGVILAGAAGVTLLIWMTVRPVPFFLVFPFAMITASLLFGIYLIAAETSSGQTVGKRAMHLRVVRESGARITLGQAIVRNLPIFLEVFLIDAMFALFTEKSQRAFELLARTRVVSAEPSRATP